MNTGIQTWVPMTVQSVLLIAKRTSASSISPFIKCKSRLIVLMPFPLPPMLRNKLRALLAKQGSWTVLQSPAPIQLHASLTFFFQPNFHFSIFFAMYQDKKKLGKVSSYSATSFFSCNHPRLSTWWVLYQTVSASIGWKIGKVQGPPLPISFPVFSSTKSEVHHTCLSLKLWWGNSGFTFEKGFHTSDLSLAGLLSLGLCP